MYSKTIMLCRSSSLEICRPRHENHARDDRIMSLQQLDQSRRRSLRPVSPVSKENEEWYSVAKEEDNLVPELFVPGTQYPNPEPSINVADQTRHRKNLRVSFAAEAAVIDIEETAHGSSGSNEKWYTESEVEQFLKNATFRAAIIERTMKYVATFEPSYNPSTGK